MKKVTSFVFVLSALAVATVAPNTYANVQSHINRAVVLPQSENVLHPFIPTTAQTTTNTTTSIGYAIPDNLVWDGHVYHVNGSVTRAGKFIGSSQGQHPCKLYNIPGFAPKNQVAVRIGDPNKMYVNATRVQNSEWVVFYSTSKSPVYYQNTGERVMADKKPIFLFLEVAIQGPSGWSGSDSEIVGVYRIPGTNPDDAVAIKFKNGEFEKAIAVGHKRP